MYENAASILYLVIQSVHKQHFPKSSKNRLKRTGDCHIAKDYNTTHFLMKLNYIFQKHAKAYNAMILISNFPENSVISLYNIISLHYTDFLCFHI